MFDINKLDPESRAFYNSLPQIARDAIEKSAKSGVRFENVDDLRDYYYNYIVDCKSPKKKASTKQSEEKGSRKRKKSL